MNCNFEKDLLFSFVEKINIDCSYISHLYKIAIQTIYAYSIVKNGKFYEK